MDTASRRRRIILVGGGALLVLIAVIALALAMLTNSALSGVRLVYDAAPLECDNTEVGLVEESMSGTYRHGIDATVESVCSLTFNVVNEGRTSVKVPSAGVRGFVELVHVNPNGSGEVYVHSPNNPDDMMDLLDPIVLKGGENAWFSVTFDNRGDIPGSECVTYWVDLPTVAVSAFGRERTIQTTKGQELAFVVGDLGECAAEYDWEEGDED